MKRWPIRISISLFCNREHSALTEYWNTAYNEGDIEGYERGRAAERDALMEWRIEDHPLSCDCQPCRVMWRGIRQHIQSAGQAYSGPKKG